MKSMLFQNLGRDCRGRKEGGRGGSGPAGAASPCAPGRGRAPSPSASRSLATVISAPSRGCRDTRGPLHSWSVFPEDPEEVRPRVVNP